MAIFFKNGSQLHGPGLYFWDQFLGMIFFLFRINFKGISFHYSKNRLLEGDFATCPQPFGLSPGAAISPPAPGGCPSAPDSPLVGAGGYLSPRGLRQSPVFGGSPQKSQPPRKIVCVWGGFLETPKSSQNSLNFQRLLSVATYLFYFIEKL